MALTYFGQHGFDALLLTDGSTVFKFLQCSYDQCFLREHGTIYIFYILKNLKIIFSNYSFILIPDFYQFLFKIQCHFNFIVFQLLWSAHCFIRNFSWCKHEVRMVEMCFRSPSPTCSIKSAKTFSLLARFIIIMYSFILY